MRICISNQMLRRNFCRLNKRQLLFSACLCVVGLLMFVVSRKRKATFESSESERTDVENAFFSNDNTQMLFKSMRRKMIAFDKSRISIDRTQPLSDEELLNKLRMNSNVPLESWNKTQPATGNGCMDIPSVYDIDFNNVYWQRMSTPNATFFMFAAYLDNRPNLGEIPVVRILAVVNRLKPPRILCQLWYSVPETKRHRIYFTRASYTYMWNKKWGNYRDGILQPYLISCHLPPKDTRTVPNSVSLVQKRCARPTNHLKVVNNNNQKRKSGFAVCVKYLDFLYEDISLRLIEWLELLNILGAKKVFLYDLQVHPNISKVMEYYVRKGLVELTHFSLPGNQPNEPELRHLYLKSKVTHKRQNEILPYNDCLHRNINSFEYLAVLDIDEVIMPLKHSSWEDLMNEVVRLSREESNYTRASYDFRNVYFLDDLSDSLSADEHYHEQGIPRYLHMLQHVNRMMNYTTFGAFVKCFHVTEEVIALHNHFPLECFETCLTYSVDPTLAHLQHYRKECVDKNLCRKYRNYTVRDTSIWRYKDELIDRTTSALSDMGFFGSVVT